MTLVRPVLRHADIIPASAGMTVVRPVLRHADIIPASAGMTVVRPVLRHADIIPASAGMTLVRSVLFRSGFHSRLRGHDVGAADPMPCRISLPLTRA